MLNRKIYFLIFLVFCSACATDAEKRREAAARNVKVVLYEYPQCNYRLVGMVTTGVERSENDAIFEAKKEAADMGAEYLSIMSIGKYAMDATSVSGKAFVCEASASQQ